MDITKIGAKIKSLRLKYGLTQEELADRAELKRFARFEMPLLDLREEI